ncbi:MAG: HDOD domain-containing protein [Betaproteobacteria bacterium]|nr:HDOD domain-containing protein [Betaproteobacteria bacterium]
MTTKATDLVQDISGLVTLPDVYLRINELIEDPNSSSNDIARVVKQDANFTIRLLKLANSALYSFPSAIDSVDKAIAIIGTAQVRSLALSLSVARSFAGLPNDLVSMENFWKHSLLCALSARHLAKLARRCDADALFTAGLLHDIGELIIFNRLPEQAKQALLDVLDADGVLPIHQAERAAMGFDHSAVGGELARAWDLPPLLEECISHHHHVDKAKKHRREVGLIHLANIIAQMAEIDSPDPDDVEPIDPLAWELTGLDAEVIEPTMRAAQGELAEVEKLFLE